MIQISAVTKSLSVFSNRGVMEQGNGLGALPKDVSPTTVVNPRDHLRCHSVGEGQFKINLFTMFIPCLRYIECKQNRHYRNPERTVGSVTTWADAPDGWCERKIYHE